ncbi:MAG: amidohydrolase [Isosphaeraceae bacterium]
MIRHIGILLVPVSDRDRARELIHRAFLGWALLVLVPDLACPVCAAQDADLILHHGRIVTVDRAFSIRQALAVKDGRILRVGTDDEVLPARGPRTTLVDLGGKMVLPGLIDSHVHPTAASVVEFDRPIPEMESIPDVLDYIHERARALGPGKWVIVRQVFITRLKEQRYPTRDELDQAAPRNPVLFATGPDASLSTLALQECGIDRKFRVEGPGKVERDPRTGEPTGILRNCARYIKASESDKVPSAAEQDRLLLALFCDYNSVGITAVIDRDAAPDAIDRYERLHAAGALNVRLGISRHVETLGPLEKVVADIHEVAKHPLVRGGPRLRIIGIKTYLDGGMLTGSAYMLEPWGKSRIYAIDDPNYRGVLFIPPERLVPIVRAAVESGLQFTAHSVGDGAVTALIDAYDEVNRTTPVRATRPCVTHSNFMSREAIDKAARLGVVVDIQPAWLYLDTRALAAQFGYDRLRYFQPLQSLFQAGVIAGGGSDHMQKIGSFRSINPYNPFLAMEVAITRRAKGYEGRLHPEEALTRAQAIQFYTKNNAHLLFLEDKIGSLEEGKQADFIVIDRDLLTCPDDEIRKTRVLATYLDGKRVFPRDQAPDRANRRANHGNTALQPVISRDVITWEFKVDKASCSLDAFRDGPQTDGATIGQDEKRHWQISQSRLDWFSTG